MTLERAIIDGDGFPIAVVEPGCRQLASYLEDEIAFARGEPVEQVLNAIAKIKSGQMSQWDEVSGAHRIVMTRTSVTLSCSYRANEEPLELTFGQFEQSLNLWIAVVRR